MYAIHSIWLNHTQTSRIIKLQPILSPCRPSSPPHLLPPVSSQVLMEMFLKELCPELNMEVENLNI